MTKGLTKTAKCPRCCPDGGAIFAATCVNDAAAWECNNCGFTKPRTSYRPTPRVTPSQQAVVDAARRLGWEVETTFIGRKLWLVGKRDLGDAVRNLVYGDSFFGAVGPAGRTELKIWRLGGETVVRDAIGVSVYLAPA